MPNWVTNTIGGWTEDLYEKYKGSDEDGSLEINFNKIIPEPTEIHNTASGMINGTAKLVAKYNDWKKENSDHKYGSKFTSPLYGELRTIAMDTSHRIGYIAIANPDKSLNQILEEEEKNKTNKNSDYSRRITNDYSQYTSLFGNKIFSDLNDDEFMEASDNYCNNAEKMFEKEKNLEWHGDALKGYKSISDYGKSLSTLKERYGADNWYDWRCNNWGTKWNSCNGEYDKETQQLRFDTAWAVPEPILAKLAQDNPDKKLDVYSEEETGWFIESKIEDGKYIQTASGEINYNEDDDSTTTTRNEINPPKEIDYNQIVEQNAAFTNTINSIKNNLLH